MGTMATIMAAIEVASKLAAAGANIAQRLSRGELTEAEAQAEWEQTRQLYAKGAQAWDEAGR